MSRSPEEGQVPKNGERKAANPWNEFQKANPEGWSKERILEEYQKHFQEKQNRHSHIFPKI